MFWKRFGFQHASGIDSLLDREDVELEAILDDDELLNECKSQNTRLIDYFQRIDVLRKLLGYASGEIEGEGMGRYKYPHVATEVLCSEIWSIVETCVREADQLLVPFWDALLDMDPQEMAHKALVAPHFAKINSVFMSKKPEEMLHFIKSQPSIINRLLSHIETPAFVDILFRIIQMEEMTGGGGVIDWLSSESLIPRLAALLSPQHSPDLHAVVADVLKGIISMCAPSSTNPNDHQIALVTNRFSRQLVSYDVVQVLVAFMLDGLPSAEDADPEPSDGVTALPPDTSSTPRFTSSQQAWDNSDDDSRSYSSGSSSSSASEYHSVMSTATERSTSSLLHVSSVLIELMRKNNSDFFEPYLFHTLRHRLIQIQQQYLPQLDRSGMDPAQRIEADRSILERTMAEMVDQMGIVHFGALLTALSARLDEFQVLLVRPRSLTGPILTTFGEMMPLTMERFRICELYAELLHCSSLSLLNRPEGYGPTYDTEGRLIGGLSALEELARVIANGANDANTPPPHVSRAPDTDSPTNSRDLQASVSSVDQMSIVSGSSEGDTEYLSNVDDSDGRSDDESNSDDMANMEEISVHDEPPREALPVAPFAVSNQRPPTQEGPDIVAAQPDLSTPLSGPASQASSSPNDIDPFTDPNEMPPSPPSEPVVMTTSIPSASSLENSEIILPAEGTTPSSRPSSVERLFGPPGDFFKSRFLDLGVVITMLDLFFEFPWNNFLHNVIYDLLHQIMTGRVDRGLNRDLVISLFRDGKLLQRIIEAQQLNDDAVAKPKGVRLGYMGHLTQISEDVINAFTHYPPDLAAILREFAPEPDWNLYVSGRFQETKDRDASQLGGGKPVVTPGQVQALRAGLAAAAAAAAGSGGVAAGLAIDEGDRIPPNGIGRGGGFQRSQMNGNGSLNGIGASPVSSNPRGPQQNVVFAPLNDDDEISERTSGGSNQFARYLVQQINGEANGHFGSSSSDASDDDDDDVGWLGEPHYAGDFEISPDDRSSPSFVSSLGAIGNNTSASRRQANSTFDDSFGTSDRIGGTSFRRTFDEDDDGGFGPFADPATAQAAHSNFTADLSGNFTFPSNSPTTPSFDLDAEFANASSSSGFTFGNGNAFDDDDDDGFGEFQGGVGLELVMSTNADGTSQPLTINGHSDDELDQGFTHGAPHMDTTPEDEDGEGTPKATSGSFDDHFGEGFEDVDPDPFGFRRRPTTGDPTGSDSSNRSNAVLSLEQTFGSVSLDDSHRDDLLDAFKPRTRRRRRSLDALSYTWDDLPINADGQHGFHS